MLLSGRYRAGGKIYLTSAGSVVKVCAGGMRIPSAPICALAGVSNSIVPRMFALRCRALPPCALGPLRSVWKRALSPTA